MQELIPLPVVVVMTVAPGPDTPEPLAIPKIRSYKSTKSGHIPPETPLQHILQVSIFTAYVYSVVIKRTI